MRIALHSCNILQVGPENRHLWQFNTRGSQFTVEREQTIKNEEQLPGKLVAKTWRSLWQLKLNVAWLPPENVFLRVALFPVASADETRAMVELQLEKLSPLPVTHIVWSYHVLPEIVENQQAVVVLIIARDLVEEFLGNLEGQGFLADRLDLGALDQLQATPINEDGAWIYAGGNGPPDTAFVAWWYGGLLRNLSLLHLPAGEDRVAQLRQQITQPAWAGELEGWLTAHPAWHLVADEATAREWEPLLRQALDEPVRVETSLPPEALASRTAHRAAQADGQANLLPAEFAKRYQQQFVDRLWMRGLFAVVALYLLGAVVYFGALGWVLLQKNSVDRKLAEQSQSYTNAIRLNERYQVLKDRQDLKFAALDCWKLVAELLPEGTVLQAMDFSKGKDLRLEGTAPADQVKNPMEFSGALRKAKVRDQQMFDALHGEQFKFTVSPPGSPTARWDFGLELNRPEAK